MSLLVLDLGRLTGFAAGDATLHRPQTALEAAASPVKKPYSGVKRLAPEGCSTRDYFGRFGRWYHELIGTFAPKVVVFEAPYVGPKTHQDTAQKLLGLATLTEYVADERNIPWVWKANVSSVRKHFIGKGQGKRAEMKRRVMDACQLRGWEVSGDNEADALALFDYAAFCIQSRQRQRKTWRHQ